MLFCLRVQGRDAREGRCRRGYRGHRCLGVGTSGSLVPARRQAKMAVEVCVRRVSRRVIRRSQIIIDVLQLTYGNPAGMPGCLLNVAISRSGLWTDLNVRRRVNNQLVRRCFTLVIYALVRLAAAKYLGHLSLALAALLLVHMLIGCRVRD